MAILKLGNLAMLKAIFDAIFNGGDSMLYKESLQYQIDRAGERTWNKQLIKGWIGADGKPYTTSPLQQLAFNAQGIAANGKALAQVQANQAVMLELLRQLVANANKGVAVDIDYSRIEAMMPKLPTEAKLSFSTPEETK